MKSSAKTALVTGAAGNLGKAVVEKFIAEGYFVIGITDPQHTLTPGFPQESYANIELDLTDEKKTEQVISTVLKQYGNIHAAVLTVGGFAMGHIANTTIADIHAQYKLNFETTYTIARPLFTNMLEKNEGRMFMIGSKPGLEARNSKGMVAYGLAKSLLFRLAELMNEEAKGKNVVVNVVVPGTIDTPPNRKSMPDATFENWVKPESIANVIFWYCTQEAAIMREGILKVYHNS